MWRRRAPSGLNHPQLLAPIDETCYKRGNKWKCVDIGDAGEAMAVGGSGWY